MPDFDRSPSFGDGKGFWRKAQFAPPGTAEISIEAILAAGSKFAAFLLFAFVWVVFLLSIPLGKQSLRQISRLARNQK